MKIGFLTSYFYPFEGGAENNCYFLAKELAKKHEVHVFTSDRQGDVKLEKEEVYENIHIHRSRTVFRYRYYLSFNPSLLRILYTKLDILHAHSFGFLWHDFIILLKRIFSKTKIFSTPHGPFMALNKESYSKTARALRKIVVGIEKLLNKSYHKVIEVNPYQYKWLTDYGIKKEKIIFIPNGIPKENTIKRDSKKFIEKYKLKNKIIISYLGRIQKYKGIDSVLEILPRIKKDFSNILFLIMGRDAGYLREIKKIIKEKKLENNVLIIENITDKEKFEGLSASEIFLFPSEWEAFGIVTLEAMAQGNAVIATDTEGSKFLVKKDSGFLFKYKDDEKLYFHLKYLLDNPKLIKKFQENNILKAKKFTWEEISKKLKKHYEKELRI